MEKSEAGFCGLEKSCGRNRAAPGWRRLELRLRLRQIPPGPFIRDAPNFGVQAADENPLGGGVQEAAFPQVEAIVANFLGGEGRQDVGQVKVPALGSGSSGRRRPRHRSAILRAPPAARYYTAGPRCEAASPRPSGAGPGPTRSSPPPRGWCPRHGKGRRRIRPGPAPGRPPGGCGAPGAGAPGAQAPQAAGGPRRSPPGKPPTPERWQPRPKFSRPSGISPLKKTSARV